MTKQRPDTIARVGATYRHFKGSSYRVVAIATHSETGESLVVYSDNAGVTWARPRWMFEDGRFVRSEE